MKAYVRRTKDFLHQKAQVETQPGFTFPGHQLLEEGQTLLVQSHTKERKQDKTTNARTRSERSLQQLYFADSGSPGGSRDKILGHKPTCSIYVAIEI
jgi:hypothetical protein